MSVTSEITRLYGVRSDIFTAIANKGVTVPSGSQLDDCPTLIGQISGGSPAPSLPAKTLRLRFVDGITPTFNYGTGVQVTSSPNVWDWTYNSSSWDSVFRYMNGLIAVEAAGDTSGVTDMQYMFESCKTLSSVCLFDTSNVTSMNYMFSLCTSLATLPALDTSSATTMAFMFSECVNLYTIPTFSTGSATTMRGMFSSCSNLRSIPLINTSSVTDMAHMFGGCYLLQSVPQLVTSNVTNMSFMFNDCNHLTTLPLFDTSSVTNMESFCSGCTALTAVPLFDTSSVENMNYAFYYCPHVQSGSLALYQQASTQTNPPTYHDEVFRSCGNETQTGVAELAQIPQSWGGDLEE